MKPNNFTQQSEDYNRIEKAIRFIETDFKSQPTLDEIAREICMSKYHFDRLFKRWAGISPIQFLQFTTLDYTKKRLAESGNILDTALDAGLSGPSRLHDLFVTFEAMTPGDYKNRAAGVQISYGFAPSPFGECLLATTDRGICFFGFVENKNRTRIFNQLKQTWPGAKLTENAKIIAPIVNKIFNPISSNKSQPFNLLIKGTNFQIKVWKALLSLPEGWLVSYQDIASYIGQPKALRAVANAIAINPIAYLIPCHRVIAKSGKINQYRWGESRKKALVAYEAARIL
jgi:AraC family transcriptional regulator, regulatory protein of adaptative response / methylated-DNA-[protein]-cysteine methyltransferase